MADRANVRFSRPSGAVFSRCRSYRYALWRTWQPELPRILFVGLNPSRADIRHNDPTIRRCIDFAQRWGYGGLLVGNLFAWRTPRPTQLLEAKAPVGPRNDHWLAVMSRNAENILACWGNHGQHLGRDQAFSARHSNLWCLRKNRSGAPAHPLYIRRQQAPQAWSPVRAMD